MSLFLDKEEVQRITKRQRFTAQCRVLTAKKIPYIRAGAKSDGEPLVRRDAIDEAGKLAQRRGHRWDRIGSIRHINE